MPTPPGFADCSYELRHSLQSRSAFITFGLDVTSTFVNIIADNLRTAFLATGSLYSCIDNNVNLVACHVSLGTDGAADIVGVNTVSASCNMTGTTMPANCSVLVHKRTGRGGRRGRGRWYIPWAATNVTTEAGVLGAADVTRVQNAVNVWQGQIIGLEGPVVLLHRPSAPGVDNPTAPGVPDIVSSFTVDPLIGTQRRRLGR